MLRQSFPILKKVVLFFKNDKSGIVHFSFGKVSFDVDNYRTIFCILKTLQSSKPASSKGKFIKKIGCLIYYGTRIRVNLDEFLIFRIINMNRQEKQHAVETLKNEFQDNNGSFISRYKRFDR